MRHFASPRFWKCYHKLPVEAQSLADKCFDLLKADPHHPSLHLKKVGRYWAARVGRSHRVLAVPAGDDFVWFWIGTHREYEAILRA
ncbi:MAG: hypothetical protein FJ291_20190 [Planctomycetes bacterium]|nr:hypothetical protein [Planctomycetota bacterium]